MQNGQNWENAYTNLQTALQSATRGDEIWIAQGTYFPTQNPFRNIPFTLPEGIAVYGGFQGTETQISERNVELYSTILSGDIGMPNDSTDNSYTVLFIDIAENDSTRVIDGITIESGNADYMDVDDGIYSRKRSGGGIYIGGMSDSLKAMPIFKNCLIRQNYARNGGGMFTLGDEIDNEVVHVNIENCQFVQNTARTGGGLYRFGSGKNFEIEITNSQFIKNAASGEGGALYYANFAGHAEDLVLRACLFQENYAKALGGAIHYDDHSFFTGMRVSDCSFTKNYTDNGEGSVLSLWYLDSNTNTIFEDCLFDDNGTGVNGTGVSILSMFGLFSAVDDLEFKNCHFTNNKAINNIFTFYFDSGAIFNNCQIIDNKTGRGNIFMIQDSKSFTQDLEINNCIFFQNSRTSIVPQIEALIILTNSFTASSNKLDLTINNSIFWSNIKDNDGHIINFGGEGDLIINNSLFDLPNCSAISETSPTCANNIFNQYPQFLDTLNQDFHLSICSPAINAGLNAPLLDLNITTDLDSNIRIQDGIVDIGPYESPAFLVEIDTIIGIPCPQSTNGAVVFNLQNACEPATISWTSGNESGNTTEGLAAGDYQFTIQDAQGKQAEIAVAIPLMAEDLQLTAQAQNIQCVEGIGGTASAIPLSGTAPFAYHWSNGMTDSLLQDLPAGDYEITLTDANGCTAMAQTTIETTGLLGINVEVSPISCHNTTDGTVAVQAFGGQAPFAYQWAGGETDSLLINLGSGSYSVSITDVYGCEDVLDFSIAAPDSLGVTVESLSVDCFGAATGQAVAIPSGGTAPFNFMWSNVQTNDTIANLSAGLYEVTVTDIQECTQTAMVEITEPTELTTDFSFENINCFAENTGMAAVNPLGGTMPYTYLWNDDSTDSLLQNLPAGEYEVTILDAHECALVQSFDLTQNDSIHYAADLIHASSPTATDGSIIATEMSGGTPPFTYFWNTGDTSASLDNLPPDTYELTITDANGCEKMYVFVVDFMSSAADDLKAAIGLNVFPNPVHDQLTIEMTGNTNNNLAIRIFSIEGKLLLEKSMKVNLQTIDLSRFANGLYLLEISNVVTGERILEKVEKVRF